MVATCEYDYKSIRDAKKAGQSLCCIHGDVYDISKFADSHPGGAIIRTAVGRDATTLYETHHNLVDRKKVDQILAKYKVGKMKNYQPSAEFNTPFAQTLLERCREAVKNVPHRDSWFGLSASIVILSCIGLLMFASFYSGSLLLTPIFGLFLGTGHLLGHAANHWSISSSDFVNRVLSVVCTNFWGLYEKNWEFSHVISHHCYNYTDRDFVMDQHAPPQFFRVRPSDPWKPLHAYQHIFYKYSHYMAFLIGGLRLDCAPFVFLSPILRALRHNKDSPLPGPQFFASGSNVELDSLKEEDDGVGPENFYIFYESWDHAVSLILANVFWLPLFLYQWTHRGFWHAVVYNFCVFGFQGALITRSLFTQHICEDIQLVDAYKPTDDWYAKQISSSVSINTSMALIWSTLAVNLQTEHHMFPYANPYVLWLLRPVVKKTAEEFGIKYFEFSSTQAASQSVYEHFKRLSYPPSTADMSTPVDAGSKSSKLHDE